MTTITRENAEIKSFITGFLSDPAHDNQSTDSLLANVFRIAQASLEAEPIGEVSEKRHGLVMDGTVDLGGKSTYRIIKGEKAMKLLPLGTKFYTAPPAPVIQADVAQAIENLKQKLVECNRYNYCADAVKGVEDACHAAMLHGAEPVSQTYKLNALDGNSPVTPDGWVMVPKQVTPEISNAINVVGQRCTCGNCSQRLWDLLLDATQQGVNRG
ncbi:TPA: hypothetical protein JLE96_003369 [Escherichia coli]|nr:hypothetical protein [Escherichia coli]